MYFETLFDLLFPLATQTIKILKKRKKNSGDLIILHKRTINYNYVMYGSWDMRCDRIFLSFWAIFCPFSPLTTQTIKTLKKWKNPLKILSCYTSVLKIMIIYYNVPEIWLVTNAIFFFFFHFRLYFSLYSPLIAQKIKTLKKWKKYLDISSFHTSVP